MLNVNAKAFVPPGVVEGVPPGFIPNTWYRYRLNVPVENRMSSVHEERYLNSISSLLSLKYLYAERGGLDDDSLQYFLNQQFILSNNTVSKENEEQTSSGFLLSRSILTLYTDVTAVASLNDSKGLLMHLDLPTESNGDVALFLGSAWESFYAAVANNSRVSSIGYSRSVVGLNGSGTDGTHRHFFCGVQRTGIARACFGRVDDRLSGSCTMHLANQICRTIYLLPSFAIGYCHHDRQRSEAGSYQKPQSRHER